MNLTFRAAQEAGFNHKSFPNLQNFISISEPEAASHFAVKELVIGKEGRPFLKVS